MRLLFSWMRPSGLPDVGTYNEGTSREYAENDLRNVIAALGGTAYLYEVQRDGRLIELRSFE